MTEPEVNLSSSAPQSAAGHGPAVTLGGTGHAPPAPSTPPASHGGDHGEGESSDHSGGPGGLAKLKARIQHLMAQPKNGVLGAILGLASGIFSPDSDTRIMSAVFIASLLGAVAVVGYGTERFMAFRKIEKAREARAQLSTDHLNEFLRKQAEEARRKWSNFSLGNFTIELRPAPGVAPSAGITNRAELALVVACDSKETRDYLESHMAQVKNIVISAFIPQSRDDLLSKAGKKKIKKILLEKLNLWLPKGKLEEAYITRLVMS